MTRDDIGRLVNEALSREYNSVSGYILQSSPFVTEGDEEALKAIQEIRDLQAATASWLSARLREHHGTGPMLKAFEYWQRDLNYLSIPYLVRFACEHFDRVAALYEGILAEVGEDAGARAIFTRLRDEARAHRKRLAPFLPKPPAPPPAPPVPPAGGAAP